MDRGQVYSWGDFVSRVPVLPYCRLVAVKLGALTGRIPRAFGRRTNPGALRNKERQKFSPWKRTATSSYICPSPPFPAMSTSTIYTNGKEERLSSSFNGPPPCNYSKNHSEKGFFTISFPSLIEGRGYLQPKSSPYAKVCYFISKAKALTWRSLAVVWTPVFLYLLNTPYVWSLPSMSGRETLSPRLHHETTRDSLSPSMVRTTLPSLLHLQQVFSQVSKREGKGTAATNTLVSTDTTDETATFSAESSNAKTTVVSFTETAAAAATQAAAALPRDGTSAPSPAARPTPAGPPARGATAAVSALTPAAATQPVGAASSSTAAAHTEAAATPVNTAATPSEAGTTPSARAASSGEVTTRTGPGSSRPTAASAEPAWMKATLPSTAAEVPEVSSTSAGEAISPKASTSLKRTAAAGVQNHFAEKEAPRTAVERDHQTAGQHAAPKESTSTSTDPDGEIASTEAGETETDAAADIYSEGFSSAPAGGETVYFSGDRDDVHIRRGGGQFSFVSTIENHFSSSAVLARPGGKNSNEAESTHKSTPATATAHGAASGREYREGAKGQATATHAEGTRAQAAGGNTAAQRDAALTQKRLLERETRAARKSAAKPTMAEKEAAERETESRREDARGRGARSRDTSQTDSCTAALEPMVHRGVSAGAAEKIKHVLEVERFLNKVHELSKIAARRCLAGEQDACESPDKPVWKTAGLSKPPEAPSIQPFRLPADLCDAPGSSSHSEGTNEKGQPRNSAAAVTSYSAKEMKEQFGRSPKKYLNVGEMEKSSINSAGAAASPLLATNEVSHEGNRGSEKTLGSERRDATSDASLFVQVIGKHDREIRRHWGGDAVADRTQRNYEGPVRNTGADQGTPLLAIQIHGDSRSESDIGSSSKSWVRGDNEGESRRMVRWSSSGQIDGGECGATRDSSERESSYHDTGSSSVKMSRWRVLSNTKNSNADSLQEKNKWQSTQLYDRGQDNAAADEADQWKETDAMEQAGRTHRRAFHRTMRAPLQLRMHADDGSPPVRPSVLTQMRSRGVFDMLQNLFGNGMDISNPTNFDGGNQGSFFNFMYPADTDYPWACVCDEHQYKRWALKEIQAVPCRNQVDTSSQGITSACNPLNHDMNAASPAQGHASAIAAGVLSVAVIFSF